MLSILNEIIWIFIVQFKGGLISEYFSLKLKSPKKICQITTLKEDGDLEPFFGDLNQSEKLS